MIQGTTIGVIQGDTRSLDCGSYDSFRLLISDDGVTKVI